MDSRCYNRLRAEVNDDFPLEFIKRLQRFDPVLLCGKCNVDAMLSSTPLLWIQDPLKPRPFGREPHDLDSPNLDGHLPPHPCYSLQLRRTEIDCGLQG
ncbi:hypothetical protein AVEN_64438-1 [Araneus ventricosus]|uniref:Uncharacterized protein n=1 Tax=Araneus ventricosus TaxID=182803 RepID=A0A4Y2MZW2_ARAVE|nr:hypothetical protein AVEN_64438-1 [Araneus ventricosus]